MVLVDLGWLRLRGQFTKALAGRRIGAFLEQQGFLWIKVGQLLSLREESFPRSFAESCPGFSSRPAASPFRSRGKRS